ncbi:oxidoreductase [Rhodopseudomonas palustris]|uniref:Probable oxidoreductase n=1 Tax=Rhodopseudomonas palustris TaxID=1076 RepID=A0A418VH96_RHOPL|nr:oxidoreductase [Rhodopseudomonas palustris]RJF75537.1 SDR family NAD(P)-dependent oxidoreductase [Rhodopseudomonas palustris]
MSTPQTPIGSGFGASATAADVVAGVDLSGQTAIVTGGASGIGLETTRALSEAGATVIVPARDPERARRATLGIAGVEIEQLDLVDPGSVDFFAARFLARGRALPILINSAGIMATPLGRDAAGHELQFATNHLGHFRLVHALWPALVRAKSARVVSVSSRGHQIAGVDFDDPNFTRRAYDKWQAYGQSKTANALFALALDARGKQHGIRAFSLHPGQILTDLARHLSAEEIDAFDARDANGVPKVDPERGMKTPQQGAATSVWCATSRQLDGLGGVYCEDCDVAPIYRGGELRKGVSPWAADPALAERLWTLSETLAIA